MYVRSTGVDPCDLSRIHIQILANRCSDSDDAALKERLLANGHGCSQNEQDLLERATEALWAAAIVVIFCHCDIWAVLLLILCHCVEYTPSVGRGGEWESLYVVITTQN
jgi:hypothetical protein